MSIPDYVEALGSPRISGDGTTERIYTALQGKGVDLLNHFIAGSHHADLGGYYNKQKSSVTGGIFDTVTLVFQSTLFGSYSGGERTTYSISNTPTARDIRLKDNYRTCWRYNLYAFVETGESVPAVPAWWSTATDLTIPSADLGKYAWGESLPSTSSTDGAWTVLKSRTVAADTYPYPAPLVTRTIYVNDETRAGQLVQEVGRCVTPGKTFGYSSDSKYWQVTACSIDRQENEWLVRTSYQFAPAKWDGRIIPGGDTEGGDV